MGKIKVPHFVKTNRMKGKGLLVLTNPGKTNLWKRVDTLDNIQIEARTTYNELVYKGHRDMVY